MQSNTSSINKDDFSNYSKRPLIMLITLFRVCNMSWCAVVLLSSRILLFFPQTHSRSITQACACIKINFNCNLNKAAIYSVTVSNCTSERAQRCCSYFSPVHLKSAPPCLWFPENMSNQSRGDKPTCLALSTSPTLPIGRRVEPRANRPLALLVWSH